MAAEPNQFPDSEKVLVHSALHEFKIELQKLFGIHVPSIRVFGSQARGTATPDSDIDILLLYKRTVDPGEEIQRIAPILADLNLRFGVLISVLPASEQEYYGSNDMFWMNVRKEDIPIEATSKRS